MALNSISDSPERRRLRLRLALAIALGALVLASSITLINHQQGESSTPPARTESTSVETEKKTEGYIVHRNITATVFWVGEDADESNKFIHNRSSAWVEDWVSSYGGIDSYENRCGYQPCDFEPKENAFYFALPYNDLDDSGNPKLSAADIPWYSAPSDDTILKNRWVRVSNGDKTAYAQWEDVGPFGEDDFDYVFGTKTPSAPEAGIDLSPAAADYLSVDGRGDVEWQFIEEKDVPVGPWTKTITRN